MRYIIIDAASRPTVCETGSSLCNGRVYVGTVCLLFVRPSVPSLDSSYGGWRVCCRVPCGYEISIDICGRRAAGAGAQQQMRVAGSVMLRKKTQHKLVIFSYYHYSCLCSFVLINFMWLQSRLFRMLLCAFVAKRISRSIAFSLSGLYDNQDCS